MLEALRRSLQLTAADVTACEAALAFGGQPGGSQFAAFLRKLQEQRLVQTLPAIRALLRFRCWERVWESDQMNDAAAAQALAAWLEVASGPTKHDVRPSPAFFAFSLRLLCAYSREPSQLAPDLELRPVLKLKREDVVKLAFRAARHSSDFLDGISPAAARAFLSAGGLDAVVHLLLFPPPDDVFYTSVAVRPEETRHRHEGACCAMGFHWSQFWDVLTGFLKSYERAVHKARRDLYKAAAPEIYTFPYLLPLATRHLCSGASDSTDLAVSKINHQSKGQLLLDVAAALLCEGRDLDASRAARFLSDFALDATAGAEKSLATVNELLGGRMTPHLRRRLASLRDPEGPVEGWEETAVLVRFCWQFLGPLFIRGPARATYQDVQDALSLFLCSWDHSPDLTSASQFLLALAYCPSGAALLYGRSWDFPACFNPGKHQEHRLPALSSAFSSSHGRRRGPSAAPGVFVLMFLGGFLFLCAERFESEEDRGHARQFSAMLFHSSADLTIKAPPGKVNPNVLFARQLPGVRQKYVRYGDRFHELLEEWAPAFGVHPAEIRRGLADNAIYRDDYAPQRKEAATLGCGNPACGSAKGAAVELRKCGRCKRAWYCSVECQRTHWPLHKEACKAVGKAQAAKDQAC